MALTPRGTRFRTLAWIPVCAAALTLVTAALAIAWSAARKRTSSIPPLAASIHAPPEIAISGAPALSPDGRAVAYVGIDGSSVARLWLRSFATVASRVVPGTEGAMQPFWSSDSRSLGYFARGSLWTVDATNGATPKQLTKAAAPCGGSWSREDIIVFAPEPGGGLYRMSPHGGPALPLTSPDRAKREVSQCWPRFLPDGRFVLFLSRTASDSGSRSTITALSVDASSTRSLLDAESTGVFSNGRLLFVRGGEILAQRFDTIELNLSGAPVAVASRVWQDGSAPGIVGFDAVEGVLAFRPAGLETHQPGALGVIDLRFNWPAIERR